MSYCVNCGVELDSSAEKCVLCNTVVINPDTQAVITTWKTGSRIRRKYGIGD